MTTSITLQLLFWTSLIVLFYIYVGYPIVCWSRMRRDTVPLERDKSILDDDRKVSIVIVAHNEARTLPRKIHSLLQSNGAGRIREILIGSDGSTDGTRQVLEQIGDPRVRYCHFAERRGKPSVLNDVIPLCQSEFVLLADARQVFDPDCLQRLLAHFCDPTVGVVSGELVLRGDANQTAAAAGIGFYWRYEKFIRHCESRGRGVPGATGACYMLRKNLFQPIPASTILDDVAIPMQAVTRGYRCLFEPGALAFDEPSKSTRQESIRKRRTIAGAAQLVGLFPQWLIPWQNPLWFEYVSHKLLRLASPVFVALALATNLTLLAFPMYQVLMLAQSAFYVAAVVGWSYQATGRGSRLFGPPLMFVTLNLTTAAALWDALFARYRVTWQKTA
ncbi:MAG: glycosyltransferase family 2 protein [Planctomycetes bacterium]|nr:glycosyltransferase family 2 protein [Planctomycetota bacterium]